MTAPAVLMLKKGATFSLPDGISVLSVGLAWEAPGPGFDLDPWGFMLDDKGKVPSDEYFIFYNNLTSPCGSVVASEDDQEGGGDKEDNETLGIDLARVPAKIKRIVFVVNIHAARKRGQTFSDLDNASIRLCDAWGVEFARYNMAEGDVTNEASLIFGELYRRGDGWKFRAIAQGDERGPANLVRDYGVEVDDEPESELAAVMPAPIPVPVNIRKGHVSLKKDGDTARIARTEVMVFSLYWTKSDKDLGLIVQIARNDGSTEYIDWRCLQDARGAIFHHGDREHGGADIREYVTVQLDRDPTITAIAVMGYSEFDNGIGSFRSMGTHAVVDDGMGTVVTVDLNKGGTFSYHTVLAVVRVNPDGTLDIKRASRFSASGSEKRPQINREGEVTMNRGPIVIKPKKNAHWF